MKGSTPFDPDSMPPWLATLWPSSRYSPFVVAGVNDDDCAVMEWDKQLLIVTTDYLNSSPMAVQLGIGDMETLGRLVVAANISDLLSTGAEPRALLIGITIPHGSSTSDFKRLMKGIKRETDKLGIPVVGGDSKLGKSLAILGVAIGSAQSRQQLFLKNAARPGDSIWASGHLGSCSAAVLGLSRGLPDGPNRRWAIRTLTRPILPLDASRRLAVSGVANGGIDVSDGLGADVCRLCDASKVGVVIDAERIPVAKQAADVACTCGLAPWSLAFAGGGEFQFIATTGSHGEGFMKSSGFQRIGHIVAGRRKILRLPNGSERPLPSEGHRDARQMTFVEEISTLAREANNGHQEHERQGHTTIRPRTSRNPIP